MVKAAARSRGHPLMSRLDTESASRGGKTIQAKTDFRSCQVRPTLLLTTKSTKGCVYRLLSSPTSPRRKCTALWFDDWWLTMSRTRRPCTVSTVKLIEAATLVDSVTVEWPDGTQDVLTNVNAHQVLTVQQTGPPLIPAVSAWGVLIILLLLLLAGTAIIRDRALLGC